ncbi:MAG: ATP-dependent sacrificial sulfur transferase LarE [Gemmatimonadota bacterium]|nr:ATP-dependent sacrificial sulfur transferase LarE [Gemmatimonadota bacterium]MDH4349114.1 ATP-dependent sacrificial sulfur transferase LarE [Gemmatimonadota bacterium]
MTAVARLEAHLQPMGRTLLGYSGGVDSAVLAVCGARALGPERFLAVIGRSASYPAVQYEQAVTLAGANQVPILEVSTGELDDPAYRSNQGDRCFHCKRELWAQLSAVARARGFDTIIDGTNADDLGEHRPGLAAGAAAGIRSPLAELGFAKREVREMARALGLPVWDAPAAPCLASRLSQGLPVTAERLRQVERAEELLRSLGIGGNLRVRHRGQAASVEADREWVGWLESRWADIEPLILQAGFARATLDPRGYRRGGLASELPVVQA